MPRPPKKFAGKSKGARQAHAHAARQAADAAEAASPPRIIGGDLRGRKLLFTPDPRTRPMKERVREALFNLLGPGVAGKHALDLFAGTGALAFEALSRRAASATLVERHFPTADLLKKTAASLELTDRVTVLPANALLFAKKLPSLPTIPWVVFCSPPYDCYIRQEGELLELLQSLLAAAPTGSLFAVEADERFDMTKLPRAAEWLVREYEPAIVAVWREPPPEPSLAS
ncbi:MAG: RsmD family RNA methyltransferase [Pirellulales bacterium]|nr:RsmD family RNA methyltransferase [Pirellulales bacterium]